MKRQINIHLTQLDDYNKTAEGVFNILDSVFLDFVKNHPIYVVSLAEEIQDYIDIIRYGKDNEKS